MSDPELERNQALGPATSRPRRSALYMPGANVRAQEKATQLDCDVVIFDLEDAVAPASKAAARDNVVHSVRTHDYGFRELIVRVNGLATPWVAEDVAACAQLPIDGLLLPKTESSADVAAAQAAADRPWWFMIETPRGVLALEEIAAAAGPGAVLVMGTSDLVRDLRAQHLPDREPLVGVLSRAVLVARAFELEVLDGVHLDFRNLDTFRRTCEQGRALGFDGRTLIHPTQVAIANEVFGVTAEAAEAARRLLVAWDAAVADGRGVVELDGQLVESLHAEDARRVLALAEALEARAAARAAAD